MKRHKNWTSRGLETVRQLHHQLIADIRQALIA